MFQLIRFPADALPDIRALVQLSSDQLKKLSELLDSKEAAPPIDQDFEALIAKNLDIEEEVAEVALRVCLILQGLNLNDDQATKAVDDFEQLIRSHKPEDQTQLIAVIDEKRNELVNVVRRKPAITRELQRRHISSGTQPAIDSIRTLVQLRPLFKRDEQEKPIGIECLIPAMTLEIKFERDNREHSATFSLTEETLEKLIASLEDARAKWSLLKDEYSQEMCD